jgi:hypothetical protein
MTNQDMLATSNGAEPVRAAVCTLFVLGTRAVPCCACAAQSMRQDTEKLKEFSTKMAKAVSCCRLHALKTVQQ